MDYMDPDVRCSQKWLLNLITYSLRDFGNLFTYVHHKQSGTKPNLVYHISIGDAEVLYWA